MIIILNRMVESKTLDAKIFDINEAKAIAEDHIDIALNP